MKKRLLLILLIVSIIIFGGCENATNLRTAYFSEITSAGSENYGVRVNFATDSRLEGKGVDVQIKFSKVGTITIWQENQDKIEYKIEDYDEWYSLESIFSQPNQETFERYEKATARAYLFNSQQPMDITMRAVAGTIAENAYQTGEILLESMPISNQFTLKIK